MEEIKEMTYEQAMSEIKRIIDNIESENQEIDGIITNVKRASELITFCKNKLRNIEDELNTVLSLQNQN